jgi:uncharacterized protein (DUF488 family)
MPTRILTIGFTKTSAEAFFCTLVEAQVRRVLDVRLHNVSQLAGFAKRGDLEYFLRTIGSIGYVPVELLAPTAEMLDAYRKRIESWAAYEQRFLQLMAERRVDEQLSRDLLDGAALLCSEDSPRHCHRRLVAEYLAEHWGDVTIHHLEPARRR